MTGSFVDRRALPEGAAHGGEAQPGGEPGRQQGELRVAAADDDRRAWPQPGRRRGLRSDDADDRASLVDRRQDVRQRQLGGGLGRPVASGEVEQVRRRTERGVGAEDAAEPEDHPVAEHREMPGALQDLRLVAR